MRKRSAKSTQLLWWIAIAVFVILIGVVMIVLNDSRQMNESDYTISRHSGADNKELSLPTPVANIDSATTNTTKPAGFHFSGHVFDTSNTSIDGATAILISANNTNNQFQCQTDIKGRFTFNNLTKGRFDITLQAQGYRDYKTSFQIPGDTEKENEYILLKMKTVVGKVVNERYDPQSDVSVKLDVYGNNHDSKREFQTENDGKLQFSLDERQSYTIAATKVGFVPITMEGDFSTPDPILVLKPFESLIVQVDDELHQPIPFADILIKPSDGSQGALQMQSRKVDQFGVLKTEPVFLSGNYTITASHEDYNDTGKGHQTVQLNSPPKKVILTLVSNLFEIKGYVLDYETNQGIPDIKLLLREWSGEGIYSNSISETVTNNKGQFTFNEIPPGEYVVHGAGSEESDSSYELPLRYFMWVEGRTSRRLHSNFPLPNRWLRSTCRRFDIC